MAEWDAPFNHKWDDAIEKGVANILWDLGIKFPSIKHCPLKEKRNSAVASDTKL